MTSAVANLTRFPTRRASAVLVLPADEKAITADDIRAALAKADGVSPEPPPSVELRGVAEGKAQYLVTFWAANRDAALAQALRALRARFPQGDVRIG
jgi:small-conductance mechanosensitive channel